MTMFFLYVFSRSSNIPCILYSLNRCQVTWSLNFYWKK
jgi:hypothetical protein